MSSSHAAVDLASSTALARSELGAKPIVATAKAGPFGPGLFLPRPGPVGRGGKSNLAQ